MKSVSSQLGGGLDLTSPRLIRSKRGGYLVGGVNYEARTEGYRRIDGYERFDGHKSPSNILDDEPGEEARETEKRRSVITVVPGVGDVLGTWRYRDDTYAFRKDSSGVAEMYRSGSAGWSKIELGYRVRFTVGMGDDPENGEALAKGAVSGKVIGVHVVSGAFGDGDAAGILVLSYDGAGRFASSDVITVDATTTRQMTLSAIPTKQIVGTGEKYEFANYNFFGQSSQQRMYGVTGTGNPFEYDGTMFLELETGFTSESPTQIAAHRNYLFVGYEEGSIGNSEVGNPREWTAHGGAAEQAIGDMLTDLLSGFRDTLFIFGRNRTLRLKGSGSDIDPWKVDTISDEAGAMASTTVLMDEPICLDDRGIRTISTTQAFGDFSIATVSEQIRPLLDQKRKGGTVPVARVRVRRKSQYRIFFSDGDCLIATYVRRGRGIAIEFAQANYDLYDADGLPVVGVIRSICSVEDSNGRERIFFSMKGGQGYVYEMDAGISFDGHSILAYVRFPFNDHGSPELIKKYKKVLVECDSEFASSFQMAADYDDEQSSGIRSELPFQVSGPSSFWDEAYWSQFYWMGVPKRTAATRVFGRGRNISLILYSGREEIVEPHTFTGITVLYDDRKVRR